MDRLSEIALRRLNQHKLGEVSVASRLLFDAQKWLEAHFEEDPRAARPTKLQNAVLWIEVKGSPMAQEVRSASFKLLTELQSRYGVKLIQKISLTTC